MCVHRIPGTQERRNQFCFDCFFFLFSSESKRRDRPSESFGFDALFFYLIWPEVIALRTLQLELFLGLAPSSQGEEGGGGCSRPDSCPSRRSRVESAILALLFCIALPSVVEYRVGGTFALPVLHPRSSHKVCLLCAQDDVTWLFNQMGLPTAAVLLNFSIFPSWSLLPRPPPHSSQLSVANRVGFFVQRFGFLSP